LSPDLTSARYSLQLDTKHGWSSTIFNIDLSLTLKKVTLQGYPMYGMSGIVLDSFGQCEAIYAVNIAEK